MCRFVIQKLRCRDFRGAFRLATDQSVGRDTEDEKQYSACLPVDTVFTQLFKRGVLNVQANGSGHGESV
jgi:hypothetical protein